MIEQLLNETNGREISSKRDLPKDQVGVVIQGESFLSYYAFPDRSGAKRFFDLAPDYVAAEKCEVMTVHIFENASLIKDLVSGICQIVDRMPWRRNGTPHEGLAEAHERKCKEHDMARYGMSFEQIVEIMNDESLQESFEAEYGITYDEYLDRMANQSEMMGESMQDGKWVSIHAS